MMKKAKILAFIQARLTSKRLPNKVLLKLGNKTVIENIFLRLKNSKFLNRIVFLVPDNKKNLRLRNFLKKKKYPFFSGSENNVLDRFYKASKKYKADIIIRITADCPLVDYRLMDKMLEKFINNSRTNYLSNTDPRSFPDGLDIEIFTSKAMEQASNFAKKKYDLEHVTPYIRNNFKRSNYINKKNLSKLRWTLDTNKDYVMLRKMFLENKIKPSTSWNEIYRKLKN